MPYADPEQYREYQKKRRQIPEIKESTKIYQREYRENHKEERKANSAIYLAKPEKREKTRRIKTNCDNRLRMEMIRAYGGSCVCCGENNPAFLSLDHKTREDRIKDGNKKGNELYRILRKHNWPDHVRLMCYNCNCGRQFANRGGECPHKTVDVQGLLLLQPERFA